MLDAWLAEVDEFGVDGATVSVGSVARTSEAVVKTTLGERSDVWLAEVSAFNVNTLEGTLIVVKSDFDGTTLAEVRIVWFTGVDVFSEDGVALLVACDVWTTEYDNPGLITSEETTFLVPIEVCVEESGKFEVNSMDNPLVALSDVEITEVDDSDVPAVDKNTLEETSDASIADFDGFDVSVLEGT